MNKERTISGIKVVVSGETYDEYKGTLQEQLEEKDKEIERLNNIIKEAKEYTEEKINIAEKKFVSIPNKFVDIGVLEYILEILDKGGK